MSKVLKFEIDNNIPNLKIVEKPTKLFNNFENLLFKSLKLNIKSTNNMSAERPFSRVFDLIPQYLAKNNFEDAFVSKINGEWVKRSASDIILSINLMSHGLYALGIRKDDKVAIISNSRPEWNITDFGIQQLGAVSVPMYPTITVEDYRYIFADAGVKIVFVSDQKLYDKVIDSISTLETNTSIEC